MVEDLISPLKLIQQWVAHDNWIDCIDFSPDGTILASASWDKSVKLWRSGSWELFHCLEDHTKSVYAVDFHPSGRMIATGANDKTIKIWDVDSGTLNHTVEAHKVLGSDSLSYSPDGSMLAAGFADGTVGIWNTDDWSQLRILHGYERKGAVAVISGCNVAFAPDGLTLASTEQGENSVKLWQASSGELIRQIGVHPCKVEAFAFSPDGQYLACPLWDDTLHIYRVANGAQVVQLGQPAFEINPATGGRDLNHRLNAAAFSSDGAWLAAGGWDKAILTWRVPGWGAGPTLDGLSVNVNSLRYSPDGKYLAAGMSDGSILITGV